MGAFEGSSAPDIGDTAKAAKRGASPRGTYDLMAAPLGPQCRASLYSPQPDRLLSILRLAHGLTFCHEQTLVAEPKGQTH